MTKTAEPTEIEAIERVIAEGGAMDYIDVVDAVQKRFHIKTSSAKVEEVHRDIVKARADAKEHHEPNVAFEMSAKLPNSSRGGEATDSPTDQLTLALQFVKSIGGLSRAKQALAELEAVLKD